MNFYYQKMQMHKNYWRSFYDYFLSCALKSNQTLRMASLFFLFLFAFLMLAWSAENAITIRSQL